MLPLNSDTTNGVFGVWYLSKNQAIEVVEVLSLASGEDKFNKCVKDGFIITDQTTVICKAILKKWVGIKKMKI